MLRGHLVILTERETLESQIKRARAHRAVRLSYEECGNNMPFVRSCGNVKWRHVILLVAILAVLAAVLIVPQSRLTLTTQSAQPWPDASIMVMHDYANKDWVADKPAWGDIDSWQYWGWDQLYNDPDVIDRYLAQAAAYDKRVAISVMLYPDVGRDTTPTSVYASLGRTAGWTLTNTAGQTTTCPLYGDSGWETAYAKLITDLGAKYNADPRVHSVWMATGIYGETVVEKDGFTLPIYYFRRWVVRAMDLYRAAFPDKPVFIMLSTTDRAYYVSEATKRGIGVKLNTLLPDPSNAILKDGNGQTQAARAAMQAGLPVAYEHAMGASAPDVYWAMLYALTWGARAIDLPVDRLDTLAALQTPWGEPMWDWTLRLMGDGDALFWVARQARTPYREGLWEGGWPGPWERGVQLVSGDVTFCAQGSVCWSLAPADLRTLYGAWGIGRWSGELLFELDDDWYADRVRVRAVVSGPATLAYGAQIDTATGTGWQTLEVVENSWFGGAFELECADCWLHMVCVDAGASDMPTMTPIPTMTAVPTATAIPTATATTDWGAISAALKEEVQALEARVSELEALVERVREALR